MKIIKKNIENYKNKEKVFIQNKHFLKSGRYYFDPINNAFIRNDKKTKEYYLENFKNLIGNKKTSNIKKRMKKIFYFIISKKINIHNNNQKFKSSIIIIKKELIKFFDINKNIVITKYTIEKDFNKHYNEYLYFSKHFKIPEIICYDQKKLMIIEEKIKSDIKSQEITNSYINNDLFPRIICNEIKYSKTNIHIDYNYDNEIMKKIPIVKQKGDLWRANLIFKKNEVYYIDFENSKKRVFYYDIFHFMWFEYKLFKNKEIIINYFQGLYDEMLKDLFDSYHFKYDYEDKYKYILSTLKIIYKNSGYNKYVKNIQKLLKNRR